MLLKFAAREQAVSLVGGKVNCNHIYTLPSKMPRLSISGGSARLLSVTKYLSLHGLTEKQVGKTGLHLGNGPILAHEQVGRCGPVIFGSLASLAAATPRG
jgi:hypothetical protein